MSDKLILDPINGAIIHPNLLVIVRMNHVSSIHWKSVDNSIIISTSDGRILAEHHSDHTQVPERMQEINNAIARYMRKTYGS